MVKDDDLKYTVGYRKPPRHAQFKPGQSGNAKGRPKKATAVDDVLYEEFNRFVTITEGRKRRRLSKLRLVVRQNINKAANGDLRAAAMLLKLLGSQKSDGGDSVVPSDGPESMRRRNVWWCGWRRRIPPGAMIASWVPWPILASGYRTRRWATSCVAMGSLLPPNENTRPAGKISSALIWMFWWERISSQWKCLRSRGWLPTTCCSLSSWRVGGFVWPESRPIRTSSGWNRWGATCRCRSGDFWPTADICCMIGTLSSACRSVN